MKRLHIVMFMLCLAACHPREVAAVSPMASPSIPKTENLAVPSSTSTQAPITPTPSLTPTEQSTPVATTESEPETVSVNNVFDGKILRLASINLDKNLIEIVDLPNGKTVATLPFLAPRRPMYEVSKYSVLRWSPNGRYLAFLRREDGTNKLNVYDTVSGKEQLVQWGLDIVTDLVWSPDNTWLAYSVWRNDKTDQAWTLTTTKSWIWTAKPFTAQSYLIGSGCHPQWTGDSRQVIFDPDGTQCTESGYRPNHLWITKTDGSDKHSLILPTPDGLADMSYLCDYQPMTGQVLACWRNAVEGSQNESAVYLFSSNGQMEQILFETKEGINLLQAHFSPAMNWVWVTRPTIPDFALVNWMVNIKDGSIYKLDEKNASLAPVSWTPNENAVVLLTDVPKEKGRFTISITDIRTGVSLFSYPLNGLNLGSEVNLPDSKMLEGTEYWAQWVSATWMDMTNLP